MNEIASLLDERLKDHADLIHTYSSNDTKNKSLEKQNFTPKIIKKGRVSSFAFQVLSQRGQLLSRSENTPSELLFPLKDHSKMVNFNGYRWFAMSIYYPSNAVWIVVAERNDIRQQIAERIILESALPIILFIPIISGFIWMFVTFNLRPISDLSKKLKKKGDNDLTPIKTEFIPRELTLLANSANDLLQRLEASFQREKRFVEDAAHELRTPISTLRVHIQNLIDDIPVHMESSEGLKLGIDRMSHLVEQLLVLNRTTSASFKSHFTRINLVEIAKKIIGEYMGLINDKKQTLSFSGEASEIYGDRFTLEVLIQNLLSNAVKYTHVGSEITVQAVTQVDNTVLKIVDNGPGIPTNQYEQVFERFYRVGGDCHGSEELGCGLGLSIVKRIVDIHGAEIFLEQAPGVGGLCVTVRFPAFPESL